MLVHSLSLLFALFLSNNIVIAHPGPHPHSHVSRTASAFRGSWVQREDHPVYDLFRKSSADLQKRQSSAAPSASPSVGSPEWSAKYPQSTPDSSQLPQSWVNAYNSAKSAGLIPNVPQTTESNGDTPVYPNGIDPNDPTVCSNNGYTCRVPDNIYDAPDGVLAIGFDDGPTDASPPLYTFLQQNNQKATHFMIGVNILNYWQNFLTAYNVNQDDICVHTWTHPYMTTLSDMDVVAQLGWTMQIIYDSTGGKLPSYWRPPYGDIDTRVTAIGKYVFGMTAIIWNQDTEDWSIGSPGGATQDSVNQNMQQWLTGPKSPGLIILEHELTNDTVTAFMDNFPLMQQNGWKMISTAEVNGSKPVYQDSNADPAFSYLSSASSTSTSASASFTPGKNSSGTATGTAGKNTASAAGGGSKNGAGRIGLDVASFVSMSTSLALVLVSVVLCGLF